MKIYISKWSLHRDVDYFVVRTINRKLIKEEVSKIITVFQYVVKKKKKRNFEKYQESRIINKRSSFLIIYFDIIGIKW